MRRVFNFSAGPAMMPEEVLQQAQTEMLDWHGLGMSIMELGHRGPEFKAVADQAEATLRELLDIPANYHVLFLPGGATAQFSMIPINLLHANNKADYVTTGIWSKKAYDEAKRYGDINIAAQTEKQNDLVTVTPQAEWKLNPNASYVHFTPNETIEGVEFHWVPETGNVPLVADMTSTILSRPINVNDYGIIYAGAQKNIGQAGITIVIIRDDLVREPFPFTPILYNYKVQTENKSFYNTPPTYSWYIAGLVLEWTKKQGGVKHFGELNQRKAKRIYDFVDQHKDFYVNNVDPEYRSIMNVPINLVNTELTEKFLEQADKEGLTNLRGHRLSGGVRASIYNAMPEAGIDALLGFMKEFMRKA